MTDLPTAKVLSLGIKRRLRVVHGQKERPNNTLLFSQIQAGAGISPELAERQARARRAARAREKIADGFIELIEETSLADAHEWLRRLLEGEKGA